MGDIDRRLFLSGAGAGLAALTGCSAAEPAPVRAAPVRVVASGVRQAGVTRPAVPQHFVELSVHDVDRTPADLGRQVLDITSGKSLPGIDTGDLTITVGLGPRLTDEITDLPPFAREQILPRHRGGDLMLQVAASDPAVVTLATTQLQARLGVRRRWRQSGFRGRPGGVGRNLLGFHDPIVNPATEAQFQAEVWRPDGSTVAVVRRLRVDVERFMAHSLAEQEQIVGRRRADGAPLSGGGPLADADLSAKTAQGRWLIPPDAHVRRAHALTSGSGMMLRRGYTFDNGPGDRGLLFISFQREPRTFSATQARLDEGDALLDFTTATASGIFWVPPGW